MEYLYNYFLEVIYLTNEMAIYLLFGFLIAGIFHVFVPEVLVNRYIGNRNLKSVLNASLLGIPLPLCSCGVIPTGMSFYKNGASKGGTVSFLISTPQTGVDSVMVTYSLLGWPFALIRPLIALITGMVGGFFTNIIDDDNRVEKNEGNVKGSKTRSIKESVKEMFHYSFVSFLQDLSKWLIIGILLAALISVAVPDDFFKNYISNDIFGLGLLLLGSIPLYVCATGSVPIAMVLLAKGLSPGAALVFLMAGPATNIATMTVLGKVLGRKSLIVYLLAIISGALFFGLLIDAFLPREWFVPLSLGHAHVEHFLPHWLKLSSSVVLLILILNGYYLKYRNRLRMKKESVQIETIQLKKFKVSGMNCNHCKMNVEKNLLALEGIDMVNADIGTSTVEFEGTDIDLSKIKETIESIGYGFAEFDDKT